MSLSIRVSRSSFFSLATSSSASVNITFPLPGTLLPILYAIDKAMRAGYPILWPELLNHFCYYSAQRSSA